MTGLNISSVTRDDGERYIFIYDDNNATEMWRLVGRYAASADLDFDWADASRIRKQMAAQQRFEI